MVVTPEEMWGGKKPSIARIAHIWSYGCNLFCPIDKNDRGGKLGAVRYEGMLVGNAEDSPSVRVRCPLKDGKVLDVR